MSQHDMNIENQGFPAFRSDLNNALAALASTSAGATAPSTTFAQQLWYDSTNNLLKMRNTDNDAWITLAYFDQTNDEWEIRSAVIQAVDSAGVVIKTDDGTTRFEVQDDGDVSIDSGTLFVDSSANRVGVLTSSPASALDVNGTTRTIYLQTSNDIILGGSNNGDIYGLDDTQRVIISGGTEDSGATLRLFGGTHSSLAKQMYLDADVHVFRAEDATGERMRIDSSGVGIGTTSPRALMDFGVGTGDAATISTTISDYQIVFDAPGGTGDYARNIGWCSGTTSIVAGITTKDEGGNTATGVRFLTGSTLGLSDVGGFSSGGNFLMDSGYGSVATAYGCRAWVNFNGNTATIREDGNVSSLTDNGTGNYTVNFATSMPDANYAFTTGIQDADSSFFWSIETIGTYSASALQLKVSSQNGSTTILGRDSSLISVAIFR
jgi:hypothetical protein